MINLKKSTLHLGRLFSIFLSISILFTMAYPLLAQSKPLELQAIAPTFNPSLIKFTDDSDKESMLAALEKSISYWQKRPLDQEVTLCEQQHSTKDIIDSLTLLKTIFSQAKPDELDGKIKENFTICQANGGDDLLVTGYYQPVLQGSLTRAAPYIYPLYKTPNDLLTYNDQKTGKKKIGRLLADGQIAPYWSRAEIEENLILQGQELVFLRDPMEVFTLHIQGSGLIHLRDGSLRAILFANSNGQPYSSIGKLLANENRIPLAKMSMARITTYLNEHIDERQRILHYNKRYIFFRWGPKTGNHGVFGSMGAELTPGRSVALDKKFLPLGMAAFLTTEQPVFTSGEITAWHPLRRFVLHHDSGAAIKGSRRLDLFWGRGDKARDAAGVMKQAGQLYFFIKKSR